MKDLRNKYKSTGFTWSARKHWKRRMARDLKKLEGM